MVVDRKRMHCAMKASSATDWYVPLETMTQTVSMNELMTEMSVKMSANRCVKSYYEVSTTQGGDGIEDRPQQFLRQ